MTMSPSLLPRLLAVAVAIAFLTACSGGTPSSSTSFYPEAGPLRSIQKPPAAAGLINPHGNRERSWMSPEAKRTDLVYLSEYNGSDVYVYSYPKGKLVGTLTGFAYPYGLCSDKAGNVFIPNQNDSNIFEYAHGGTSPIATLSDPYGYPLGCAVDPTSGDLAITNYPNYSNGGNIAIYPGASGTPTDYSTGYYPYEPYFCDYDDMGNLFVDGYTPSSQFSFGELAKGSQTFTTISLPQSFDGPGGVQWDGKRLAIASRYGGAIYQFKFKGSTPKEVGSTTLEGGNGTINQFAIDKDKVVGPDWNIVGVWPYPAGGNPTTIFNSYVFVMGTTISRK
jgi:hypothetical protein